jgi:hypothetical protein
MIPRSLVQKDFQIFFIDPVKYPRITSLVLFDDTAWVCEAFGVMFNKWVSNYQGFHGLGNLALKEELISN